MQKELKFNQCQDCGCPGAQLTIVSWDENLAQVKCPYCGRKGSVFPIARGMWKGTPNTKIYLSDGTIMTYEEYLEYIANN